jgi:hypothetical protein
MLRIIYESLVLIVAFSMGLYAFRYMNLIYRIFFFQLLTYILIYILSFMVQLFPKMHNQNQWVYNLAMPLETGFLSWAAYEYFKSSKARILIWIGLTLFLIAFFTEIFFKGISVLSNHGFIVESGLALVLYLFVLNSQFTGKNHNWKRSPDIWISLGLVLYFAGVVPYFSLIHYLQISHPRINLFLFNFIIIGLSNVRYLFLAVGFWFVRRNVLSKITGLNE